MQRTPQELVMSAVTGHWLARCVHAVAEAGIADRLGDSAETATTLAAKADVDPGSLDRILRYLVSCGLFETTADGYAHNEASRLLRSDHPVSLRAYARMLGSNWQWQGFGALGHALKTGETGVSKVFGMESFDYLAEHPAESDIFNAAMQSRSTVDLSAALDAYDFGAFGAIADIGGGSGGLLLAILNRCPAVSGVLFDLPHVIDQSGLAPSDRLSLAPGDFFRDAIPSADAYLLRRVIHDWRDEPALAILSAIRRSAKPGSRLILLETPLPEDSGRSPAKGLDIVMLTVVGGRERTLAQYRALIEAAGFEYDKTTPTSTGLALIEAVAG